MKRLTIVIIAIFALTLCAGACADPARTDGAVTAWIGEENALFLKCTDQVTRKLSVPMKDILSMTATEVIGLTQTGQIVAVKKDGSGYSILTADATEEAIASQTDATIVLENGRLSVGEVVYSERAVAAVSDGLVLYWVNKGDNGFVLMQKAMPNKDQAAIGRAPAALTGMSVPEPIYLCVTAEALTLTAADHSIISISLKTGESKPFPASGLITTAACMADDRLYRYDTTEQNPWVLETILNDAMQLVTVTPAPTAVPTTTPQATLVPTAVPGNGGNGGGSGRA